MTIYEEYADNIDDSNDDIEYMTDYLREYVLDVETDELDSLSFGIEC